MTRSYYPSKYQDKATELTDLVIDGHTIYFDQATLQGDTPVDPADYLAQLEQGIATWYPQSQSDLKAMQQWKKDVSNQIALCKQELNQYQSLPLLKRLFTKKPEFESPIDEWSEKGDRAELFRGLKRHLEIAEQGVTFLLDTDLSAKITEIHENYIQALADAKEAYNLELEYF